MMLAGTATAIHATADLLGAAEQGLPTVDPGAAAFGASALGLLGAIGREASLRWQEATEARVREARAHAVRVRELAELVGQATAGLREAQEEAAQRGHRELTGADGRGVA